MKLIVTSRLSYVYTDELEFTWDSVFSLLNAGNKYNIWNLMLKCSDFLQKRITIDTAFIILENAHMFDLQDLFQKCKNFILKNSTDMLVSTELLNICSACLKSIISSDDFGEDELDIYTAVMTWAEHQCDEKNKPVTPENKRLMLGDLLYEIRFPLMDSERFAKLTETGILTADEQLDVFKVISKGIKDSTKFVSKCRISCERVFTYHDLKRIAKRVPYKPTLCSMLPFEFERTEPFETDTENITIHASRRVLLTGVVLHRKPNFVGILDISIVALQQPMLMVPVTKTVEQTYTLHKQYKRIETKKTSEQLLLDQRKRRHETIMNSEQLISVALLDEDDGEYVHVKVINPLALLAGNTYTLRNLNQN